MFDERVNSPASRWVSVIFLQGEQADKTLDLIDRSGPTAAIEYLQQWDFGDETTDAALTNGYVYDRIPAGSTDRTLENDDSPYALTYSPPFGYVSLLRRYSAESEPGLVPAPRASAKHSERAREDIADPWAAKRDRPAIYARHTVAL
jgi:hypothetical protein